MIRNRIFLRGIAAFLILETLFNTIAPTVSWALTSGPTAPEATSFEPVDTTDMVNLFTGDLAYSTPLIEVPGPNGGYPLSLSYHAGIQPGVESSYVGLGWSLNPGSISRIVNGYADDHTGPGMQIENHFYWDGEEQTTYTLGIHVPVGGAASVTAGLSFTQHSQYGFSVNPYIEGGLALPGGVGISASSVTGTAQMSIQGMNQLNMLNSTQNIKNTIKSTINGITSKRIGLGPFSLDMSLSSKGIKSKFSVAGFEKSVNRQGKVNRIQSSSGASIGFVSLQRTYTRVWIDEKALVNTSGAMYFPMNKPASYESMNVHAYDTYDLFYNQEEYSVQQKDPQLNNDGSFADYDDFQVNAQGLNGSIRPYHYYEYLLHQNRNDEDKNQVILRSVPMGATGNRVGFRFINDFSNRFLFDPPAPTTTGTGGYGGTENITGINMQFNSTNITAGRDGQGYQDNILAGSSHIEYFDNRDIVDRSGIPEGFIDCTADGFTRDGFTVGRQQIGSFKITNESGVTYHFALPAYSSSEYSYTEKIDAPSTTYNEITKSAPYAYTWYLTAITGPDYVDRSGEEGAPPNGKLDNFDYGYWVDFGYRKWSNDYHWRNPVEGFNLDLDHNFKTFSYGKKEVYYLDYVRTASHILLFDKSQRLDGRGVVDKNGGYSTAASSTVARLDKVYLLNIDDFNTAMLDNMPFYRNDILSKSIRSVGFQYDYSLCNKTSNSFSSSNTTEKQGKLTLTGLEYYGKQGVGGMIPPLKFGYELEDPVRASAFVHITSSGNTFSLANSMFKVGDILKITQGGSTVYGLLNGITGNSEHQFIIIDGSPIASGNATLVQTKNPPYNKEKYDAWGLYKSDFIEGSSSEARVTSPLSAKSVDVWSLRSIKSPTGSTIAIDYEADYYDEVVLANSVLDANMLVNQQALRIKSATKLPNNRFELFFYNEGYSLTDLFAVNDQIPVYLMGAYKSSDLTMTEGAPPGCSCPSIGYAYHDVYDGPIVNSKSTIVSINAASNSVIIEDWGMANYFSKSQLSTVDYTVPCANYGDFPSCQYSIQSNQVSFFAGGIAYAKNKPKYAGGIRVKNISLRNLNKGNRLHYNYGTGVTSYEPVSMLAFKLNPDYYSGLSTESRSVEYEEASFKLKSYTFKHYSNLLNIAREVPGPAVMYRSVDVRTFVSDEYHESEQDVFQRFEFQTFSKGMIRYNKSQTNGNGGTVEALSFDNTKLSTVTLDDLTQAIGNLKSMATYNQEGSLLSATHYQYLHDDYLNTLEDGSGYSAYRTLLGNKINSQGIVNESFSEARIVRSENSATGNNRFLFGITSKRRTYPSVKVKETTINYKTGIKTTNETLSFDFFSGEETKTLSSDGYGNHFLHEVTPAYTVYPEMGLGMYGKKNMLTQQAAAYAFEINPAKLPSDADYKTGVVSGSVQTWSNQIPVIDENKLHTTQPTVWRKSANYQFIGNDQVSSAGDGFYSYDASIVFNSWDDMNVPATWQKDSEVLLYDMRSNGLEARDLNGIYSATKYTSRFDKVIATAVNANYDEFVHSGFEELGDASIDLQNANVEEVMAHTGKRRMRFSNNQSFGTVSYKPDASKLTPGRKYMVSYWVNGSANNRVNTKPYFKVNGGAIQTVSNNESESNKVTLEGNEIWYLHTGIVTVPENCTSFEAGCQGGSVAIDDFRFQPVDASLTAYVYNEYGELTYALDNNNLYTKYNYDGMGRLKETYKETFANGETKTGKVIYHYANQND
jgi:hypothetical protein